MGWRVQSILFYIPIIKTSKLKNKKFKISVQGRMGVVQIALKCMVDNHKLLNNNNQLKKAEARFFFSTPELPIINIQKNPKRKPTRQLTNNKQPNDFLANQDDGYKK